MIIDAIPRDLLITPSIYDAYEWAKNAPPSWKESAFTGLMNSLTRVPWSPSKAIQRGIAFENLVYTFLDKDPPETASIEFRTFVEEIKGAKLQKKIKKSETIEGQSFCLYGKTDAWFPDIIKDVKTTGSFKARKYAHSFQHEMYCYIEQIRKFRYVVAVFNHEDDDDKKIQRVEKIDIEYTEGEMQSLKETVHRRVMEFYGFVMNDHDFRNAYLNKFCLY